VSALAAERDAFAAAHPERAEVIGGRRWGVLDLPGEGPALLLCPGTLGRGDVFWRLMARLRGRARMLAVTYPASHDLGVWADDLARLLDRRGIGRTTVLGSSLGGYLAQVVAGRHGERVEALVAANTLSDVGPLADRPPYAGDVARTPLAALREGFARGLRAYAEAEPDAAELMALLLQDAEGRIPGRHLRARIAALKLAPPVPAIAAPPERVHVIESEDDPLIPEPVRAAVRTRLAPGTVWRFRKGGHFPYVSQPDLYAAAVEEALGLTAPGRGPWGGGALRAR